MDEAYIKKLRASLKVHAHALGIAEGAAESFIDETIKSVEKTLKGKTTISQAELTRIITKELRKYHADFAYVYKNHDKII